MNEELKWEGLWKCPACFKIMPEKTHKHNVPWNKGIWCNGEMIPHDRRAPDPEKARKDAQWISVEERLPEEDVDVLICVRWPHKESCITQAAYFDGDWEVAQSGDWISGRWITHWTSLPSVP